MNRKAIALLSGGLDSSLAVKMMLDQGIEIVAVNFMSAFCNCTPKKAGCRHQASKIAEEFGIPIQVISKGMDYIKMVRNAPHGYGKGMNPCIDCRIYMLKKVKELMSPEGASFIVTGEVLGQRPMSQHRQAIRMIEKESGLEGLILRPLSAQYFTSTVPEQEGLVDRQRLLAISGRSRKPQIELAETLGVRDYPCPAGGCLLTDKVIAARLRDLFTHNDDFDMADIHLLKVGRHFRFDPGLKVVIGRNKTENEQIGYFARCGQAVFSPSDFRGPTALACGLIDKEREISIAEIMARYCQDAHQEYTVKKRIVGGEESELVVYRPFLETELVSLQVGYSGQPADDHARCEERSALL
jgi:tRNA-uridine 2-sulfurtransferase